MGERDCPECDCRECADCLCSFFHETERDLRSALAAARAESRDDYQRRIDAAEAAIIQVLDDVLAGGKASDAPLDISAELARVVRAIRINIVMREKAERELASATSAREQAEGERDAARERARNFALCLSCGLTRRPDEGCCATCGLDLVFVDNGKPSGWPCELPDVADRMTETIRTLESERDAAIRERDEHHQMLRDILALCDDSVRACLGPDAPLRAVKKLKADRDSYANSNFEGQLAAERREVARLESECERLASERDSAVADMEAAEQRMLGVLDGTFSVGDGTAQREIERLRADCERMRGLTVRKFYIDGCSDSHGARVWAAVTDGPAHATSERTKWTVYHRPEFDALYPAKLTHVDSLADAIEKARELAAALTATTPGGDRE